MHRNILRAGAFPDGGPGTRGTTVFALFPHDDDVMEEITVEDARQALSGGAALIVWASGHYERAVVHGSVGRPPSAGPMWAARGVDAGSGYGEGRRDGTGTTPD